VGITVPKNKTLQNLSFQKKNKVDFVEVFRQKDFHRRRNLFSLCVCWLKRCLSLSQRQGFSALVPFVSQMFAVVLLSGCGNCAAADALDI
jgi:hypothetical protein